MSNQDKLTTAYQQTLRDLERANQDVMRLTERKKFLEELGASDPAKQVSPKATQQSPKKAPRRGKASRPPRGAVESAVMGVLTAGTGMVNAEVRQKLADNKYPYSLHTLHMGKVLNRLASKGIVKKQANGLRVEYSLMEPRPAAATAP